MPTVAIAFAELVQLTRLVKFCELPSENDPVAVNCTVVPATTPGDAGVTEIEFSVAAVTVTVVDPVTWLTGIVAEIVAVPSANALRSPRVPAALLTRAIVVLEDTQATTLVTSFELPSE